MFNNCYANYGTTNAREIADLLNDLELDDSRPLNAPNDRSETNERGRHSD